MHELSLAREMVRLVERQAAADGFTRVVRIHLTVGVHSCVAPEALRFAFESLRSGLLADAELVIRSQPARGACRGCGTRGIMGERIGSCPACGGIMLPEEGDDLKITELEVS